MNAIHSALNHLREGRPERAEELLAQLCTRPADADAVEAEARTYCTDDLEIDDRACFSDSGEEGCWVSAWVWVPRCATEED